jgi:hypothetical protein
MYKDTYVLLYKSTIYLFCLNKLLQSARNRSRNYLWVFFHSLPFRPVKYVAQFKYKCTFVQKNKGTFVRTCKRLKSQGEFQKRLASASSSSNNARSHLSFSPAGVTVDAGVTKESLTQARVADTKRTDSAKSVLLLDS